MYNVCLIGLLLLLFFSFYSFVFFCVLFRRFCPSSPASHFSIFTILYFPSHLSSPFPPFSQYFTDLSRFYSPPRQFIFCSSHSTPFPSLPFLPLPQSFTFLSLSQILHTPSWTVHSPLLSHPFTVSSHLPSASPSSPSLLRDSPLGKSVTESQ